MKDKKSALGKNDVIEKVNSLTCPMTLTVRAKKAKYYLPVRIRIPKFFKGIFGDRIITELVDCVVSNWEDE